MEYKLNKEYLLEMMLLQLQSLGNGVRNCNSINEINDLSDKILNTGDAIEKMAKEAIDEDELSEEFVSKYLPRLYNLCSDIALTIILKSLDLSENGDNQEEKSDE